MRYGLTLAIMGDIPFLELSKEQFDEIVAAKASLIRAMHIEDKFDIVLQNYADLEVELLARSVHEILHHTSGWVESIGRLHAIGRRMINLLTTCRLYLDQVEHNISELFGNASQAHLDLKLAKSREYDAYLGYRVMEALRNYVQHRGFPLHGVTVNSHRVEIGGESLISNSAIPLLSVETLERDRGFKVSIMAELKALSPKCDLRPMIREYIASIARIHDFVRNQLKSNVDQSEQVLAKATRWYKDFAGDSLIGFAAVSVNDAGNFVDKFDIFDEFMERRKMLMSKNRSVAYCAGHFVTNGVG